MKKILFAANLESFFIKFLVPELKWFKENGYEVHVASKSEKIDIPYCDKKFNVDFARGFNIKQNLNSYKQMKKILKENEYDIISCHTPFGGAVTRYAAKKCHLRNTKIVYMAHGFHFYKGAPLINWLLFYTAEKYLAKFTDNLITINLDDYKIAKSKFKTNVYYVPGVGLDETKFAFKINSNEKKELRNSLGLKAKDFVMIYPAEILPRKRQIWLMEALKDVLISNPNFHILLPGKDSMNGKCQEMAKNLKLDKQIHFLGFRKDIPKLLNISDLAITTSMQEGLPVNVMEAIYVGIPVVATDCRGNRDLIKNNKNGYIVGLNDQKEFSNKVIKVYEFSKENTDKIKKYDKEIIQDYLLDNVIDKIIKIHIKK